VGVKNKADYWEGFYYGFLVAAFAGWVLWRALYGA
jgi:hypothetical protein